MSTGKEGVPAYAEPALAPSTDDQDELEMEKLGKLQQLKRRFSFWHILGFSVMAMVTWVGTLITFVYGLQNGGPAGLIIGYFFVWSGYGLVVASLAELMSMWPTSGGQYHWTYTLAPARMGRFLSYICAWQTLIAWQAATASVAFLAATMIQGLVVLNYPTYTGQGWHGTLIMFALTLLAVLVNIFMAQWLPKIELTALVLYIAGFIVVLVAITVMAPYKASAHDVFQVFTNSGGWSSSGLSFWVGLQGIVFAWVGADGAIHMAEEVHSASTIIPTSLVVSVGIDGVLAFAVIIAVLYSAGNLDDALSSSTGYPVEEIFTFATQSVAGGTGLTCILIVLFIFTLFTEMAAASREMWAFARDDGLPGSHVLKRIHKSSRLPLWTILATVSITLLLSLINIGSSIALNAVVSLTVAGFIGSYIIPLSLLLYRRVQAVRGTGKQLPFGPWTLGKWTGLAINAYALVWSIVVFFWSFWPFQTPTTYATMNWSVLAYGLVTAFAVAFWLVDGRKRYRGPVRDAAGGIIEPVISWSQVEQ